MKDKLKANAIFSRPSALEQVVIMLVIDKENDRALLSRQSRFVPRMWSCLAGFIEVCGATAILETHFMIRESGHGESSSLGSLFCLGD